MNAEQKCAWLRKDQINIHVLGDITFWGAIVFLSVRGATVLTLYRRHVEADND